MATNEIDQLDAEHEEEPVPLTQNIMNKIGHAKDYTVGKVNKMRGKNVPLVVPDDAEGTSGRMVDQLGG